MSLLGKILAVLNILGAVVFVILGFMDYAKREAWAYVNYTYDVAFNGLPLDDKQLDDHESSIKANLTAQTKKEWFGDVPVSTQIEEVDRVKKASDEKTAAAAVGDALKETVETARILTPFARHYTEREWLLSVGAGLSAPADQAKLQKRLHDSFTPAVMACLERADALKVKADDANFPLPLKFPQAFTAACRAQGVDLATAFEQTFLNLLPAKPESSFDDALKAAYNAGADPHTRAQKFLQTLRDDPTATVRKPSDDAKTDDGLDKIYKDALTSVHDQLKAQLEEVFDQARNGPKSSDAGKTDRLRSLQHAAAAHYLFNMVEGLGADDVKKGGMTYGRFVQVVGVSAAIQEMHDQAAVLQRLAAELEAVEEQERGEFAVAHRMLIAELKDRAVRLHHADDLLVPTKLLFDKQDADTKAQKAAVIEAENSLAEVRAQTDAAMEKLRQTSDDLQDLRNKGRDVLGENLDLEKQIRDLEKKH
jgi:hypothetical protein